MTTVPRTDAVTAAAGLLTTGDFEALADLARDRSLYYEAFRCVEHDGCDCYELADALADWHRARSRVFSEAAAVQDEIDEQIYREQEGHRFRGFVRRDRP